MQKRLRALENCRSSDVKEEDWLAARHIARQLDKILDGHGSRHTLMGRAATELGLSTRQVYHLLARYRLSRSVSALLPCRREKRRRRLPSEIEQTIAVTLRERWLLLEAPPLAPVVAEIRARCAEAGLSPPSYSAVSSRIPLLFTPEEIARRRSANPYHLQRLKPRPGYIHAARPLDVCQIDHTPTDINFVEVVEGEGTYVGRAYLTIVTDVFSRCILGFCLSLEKPSSLSVALCLAQTMCPKNAWLSALRIEQPWPMFGRPRSLVADSAKEFKGFAFQHGCEEYGIAIRYRDRGRVHEGGVVERLLGKLNAVLATCPGSTGRSVADRDQYPALRRARLSFTELERCVTLAIIDHNLHQNSKTLKIPDHEWQRHIADIARFHDDPAQVLLNFLPRTHRRLTQQGISMFALDYYSQWLGGIIPRRDRFPNLEVRYDPRDVSHVYVRDPDTNEFRPVERRDGCLARITLWQHRGCRHYQRGMDKRSEVDKVSLRREIAAVVQHSKRSNSQLRNVVRGTHAAEASKLYEVMSAPPCPPSHPVREKRRLPVEDW